MLATVPPAKLTGAQADTIAELAIATIRLPRRCAGAETSAAPAIEWRRAGMLGPAIIEPLASDVRAVDC
jgi:hypothetical protein